MKPKRYRLEADLIENVLYPFTDTAEMHEYIVHELEWPGLIGVQSMRLTVVEEEPDEDA